MQPSRLERYLDGFEQPLALLPAAVRQEWREEARQHLLSLIAAHEELGTPPEAAIEAALRQFGNSADIGRKLQAATLRPSPLSLSAESKDIRTAILLNMGMLGLFSGLMHLPGAYDLLAPIGISLGVVSWAAGTLLGRSMKSLPPRPAGGVVLWAGSYTVLPYLVLLAIPGLQDATSVVALTAKLLGGGAALAGLFLGVQSTYRARRSRSEPPSLCGGET